MVMKLLLFLQPMSSLPLWRRVRVGAANNSSADLRFCWVVVQVMVWKEVYINNGWCPKMYAASNKSVVDIEKSDGKCLNVIEHLLGKTAGFAHRAAYPLA